MISIALPVYNEEKVIAACLDSLATQQPPPDEIVIADNNSTDQTLAHIETARQVHPDIPIHVTNEPMQGIPFAREAAWRKTTGNWIIQVDADVIAPAGWLARIQASLNDNVDVIAGTIHFENAPLHISIMRVLYDFLYPPLTRRLYGFPAMNGTNLVIRRSVLEQIDGYRQHKTGMSDDRYFAEAAYRAGAKISFRPDIYVIHSLRRYRQGGLREFLMWGENDTPHNYR